LRAGSLGWQDEHDVEEKRRLRNALYTSLGVHVLLVAALVISPPTAFAPLPQTIAVELVAGPQIAPPAAPRAAGRPKPPPPAPAPPKAEPAPEPPAPTPPPPKAPVQVLPENAPKPDKKVKQAPAEKPKELAKVEPKPEKPAEKPVKQPETPQSYDDVMQSLEDELGEDTTDDLLAPAPSRPAQRTAAESSGHAQSQAGIRLSPEEAAWMAATRRQIQMKWVTPSSFRNRGLATVMQLELSASGEVIGQPEVVRSSGDPYYDDNAVAAVLKASPLPAPPRAGKTSFIFSSEEY